MSNSRAVKFILTACYTLTACFTALAVFLIAPYLETRYWPVVGKMKIEWLTAEEGNENQTRIHASFTKIRNCDYIGIAWFRGNRVTGFIRVPLQLMRMPNDVSSPNRPLGYQQSGPWIVDIPQGEIEKNSFVELYHQCTPFWVSRTEFYP